MFDLFRFLGFLILSTVIFFLPNHPEILLLIFLNIFGAVLAVRFAHINLLRVFSNTLRFLPFILLVFVFNLWLDSLTSAIWISFKLLIVCNLTMIYAATTSTLAFANTMARLTAPLRIFGVDPADVRLLVCVALALVPVIQRDLRETKTACAAKGLKLNLKNSRTIVARFLIVSSSRISDLEASLLAKNYQCD